MSRQHGDYKNAFEHQRIPKRRRLLLDNTVADDSLLQYEKSHNWWTALNEDSDYTVSNFLHHEEGNFSSRRSESINSIRRSIAGNEGSDSLTSRVTSGSGFSCNFSDNTEYPSGSVRIQRRHRRQPRLSPSEFKIAFSRDTTIAQDPSYRYSDDKSSFVADLSVNTDLDSESEKVGDISRNIKCFKYARLKRDRMVTKHNERNEFETVLNDITINDSENRVQHCLSEGHVDAEDAGVDEVSHLISNEKSSGDPSALTYCRQIVTHGGKVEGTTYITISEIKDKIIYQGQKSGPRGKRRVIPDGAFNEAMSEFSYENNIDVGYGNSQTHPEGRKAKTFDENDGELNDIQMCSQLQSNFNSEKLSHDEDVTEVLNRSGPRLSESNTADEIDVPHLRSHRKKRRRERRAISENLYAKILEDGSTDISKNVLGTEMNVSQDRDASISHDKSHKIHKTKNYDCMKKVNMEEIAHNSYLIRPEEVRVEGAVSMEIESREPSKCRSRMSRRFSNKTLENDGKSRFISVANISDEIDSFNTGARRKRNQIKAISKNAFDAVLGDESLSESSSAVDDFNGSKEKPVPSVLDQAIPETVKKTKSNILKNVMEGSAHGSSPIKSKELSYENLVGSEIENHESHKGSLRLNKRLSNKSFNDKNSKSHFISASDITDEVDTNNVRMKRKRSQIKAISKNVFDAVLIDESSSESLSSLEDFNDSKEKLVTSISEQALSNENINDNNSKSHFISVSDITDGVDTNNVGVRRKGDQIKAISKNVFDGVLGAESVPDSCGPSAADLSTGSKEKSVNSILDNTLLEDIKKNSCNVIENGLEGDVHESCVIRSKEVRPENTGSSEIENGEPSKSSSRMSRRFSNKTLENDSKSRFISVANISDEIDSFNAGARRKRNQIKAISKDAFDAVLGDESLSESSSAVDDFNGSKEKPVPSVLDQAIPETVKKNNSNIIKNDMEGCVCESSPIRPENTGSSEIENGEPSKSSSRMSRRFSNKTLENDSKSHFISVANISDEIDSFIAGARRKRNQIKAISKNAFDAVLGDESLSESSSAVDDFNGSKEKPVPSVLDQAIPETVKKNNSNIIKNDMEGCVCESSPIRPENTGSSEIENGEPSKSSSRMSRRFSNKTLENDSKSHFISVANISDEIDSYNAGARRKRNQIKAISKNAFDAVLGDESLSESSSAVDDFNGSKEKPVPSVLDQAIPETVTKNNSNIIKNDMEGCVCERSPIRPENTGSSEIENGEPSKSSSRMSRRFSNKTLENDSKSRFISVANISDEIDSFNAGARRKRNQVKAISKNAFDAVLGDESLSESSSAVDDFNGSKEKPVPSVLDQAIPETVKKNNSNIIKNDMEGCVCESSPIRPENTGSSEIENGEPSKSSSRMSRRFSNKTLENDSKSRFISVANISDEIDSFNAGARRKRNQVKAISKNAFDAVLGDESLSESSSAVDDFNGSKEKPVPSVLDQAIPETVKKNNSNIIKNDMEGCVCERSPIRPKELKIENVVRSEAENQEPSKISLIQGLSNENLDDDSKSHFISAANITDEMESFSVDTRRRRNQIKTIVKNAFDAIFDNESVSESHGSSAVEAFHSLKEKKLASVSAHKFQENDNNNDSHVNKEIMGKEISTAQAPNDNSRIKKLNVQNREFDVSSLISVPSRDSLSEVVDNQGCLSKRRSKLKEVLSKHQGAFTAALHGASLSGSDSSCKKCIGDARPGENSQSNPIMSERIEKDCVSVIDDNKGMNVHPSRAETSIKDDTNFKKSEGNVLGLNKQQNLEVLLQGEDMLPANESKAQNLEGDSLAIYRTPILARNGIGESTRGFIAIRDKSPYSLFLKHFEDVSSIMSDSVGGSDSKDSQRNNTLTDSKSKILLEVPNSKTAVQELDNEIEDLRLKSSFATGGDSIAQELSQSFIVKGPVTESHSMKKLANSDVKSLISEMKPFETKIASPKELLRSEGGLVPVSALIIGTEITESDLSVKDVVEIMAPNTEQVLQFKPLVAPASAFHSENLGHNIDSFNKIDGDRAKTDEQDVSEFRVSSLSDDDTVTDNLIKLSDGTDKAGPNVDKNESLKPPCEGVSVSNSKAVVQSTATEMAIIPMEFNGGSHKVNPNFDKNPSFKSSVEGTASYDSNSKTVVESKADGMTVKPLALNDASDRVNPNIDIKKNFKSSCEGAKVSVLNLQAVIESAAKMAINPIELNNGTDGSSDKNGSFKSSGEGASVSASSLRAVIESRAAEMEINLVKLNDDTDGHVDKNNSFKSPCEGAAVSASNLKAVIESRAAEMEINPVKLNDDTDGHVDKNNSFKSPCEGAAVSASNLQAVIESRAAEMEINPVKLNDGTVGHVDKNNSFKSPGEGVAISVTNLQAIAESAVTEVEINQIEFNNGHGKATPNIAKSTSFYKKPCEGAAVLASNLLTVIEPTITEVGINDLTFVKSNAPGMTSTPQPFSVPSVGDKIYTEAVSIISSINELSYVKSTAHDFPANPLTFPVPEVDDMAHVKRPSTSSINEVTFIKSNVCDLSTIPEQVSKISIDSKLPSVASSSKGITFVALNAAALPTDPQRVSQSSSGDKTNVVSPNALGISDSLCIKLPSPVISVTQQLSDKAIDKECTQHLRVSSINELTFIKSNVFDLPTIPEQISKLSVNSDLPRVASPSKEMTFVALNAPALSADLKVVSESFSGNKTNTKSPNALEISDSLSIKPALAYSATSEPAAAQSDDSELLSNLQMVKELTFTITTAPCMPSPQLISKHSIGENRNASLLSGSKAIHELTFVKSIVEKLPTNPNRDSEPLHVDLEAVDPVVNSPAFNELNLNDPSPPKSQKSSVSKLDISNLGSILSDQISESKMPMLPTSLEEKTMGSDNSDKHSAPQQILEHSADGTFIMSKSVTPKFSNSTFTKPAANLKHFQNTLDSELLQLSPLNIDLLNISFRTSSTNSEAPNTNLPSTKESTVSEVHNEEANFNRSHCPRKSGPISPARGSSIGSLRSSIATESDTSSMRSSKVIESDISSMRPRDSCISSVTYSSAKESDGASLRPSSVRLSDFSSVASSSATVTEESLSTPMKKSYKYFSTSSEEERKAYDEYLAKIDDMVAQRKQQDMVVLQKIFPKDILKEQNQRLQNHRKPQPKKKKEDGHFEEKCVVKRKKLPVWVAKDLRALVEEAMEGRGKCFTDAEEFLFELVDTVKKVVKSRKGSEVKQGIQKIQEQLLELNLIRTLSDFYEFVRSYMPLEFRHRSIPCTGKNKEIHPQWDDETQLDKTLLCLNE